MIKFSRRAANASGTLVVTSPHNSAFTAGNIDVALLFNQFDKLRGVSVAPFSLESAAAGAYDVIHIHWPEWLMVRGRGSVSATRSASAVLHSLSKARRKGTVLVWDANNTRPHEPHNRTITKTFLNRFSQICDLLLVSNGSLADAFITEFPALMETRRVYLGNINYCHAYADENIGKAQARALLGLNLDSRICLSFGAARRYKNLPTLISTFRRFSATTTQNVHLVIAGNTTEVRLRREIEHAAAGAPANITLDLRPIPDRLVAPYFRAADVTVVATSQSVKSSVTGLSMSLGTPVWTPRRGAADDYSDEVGGPMLNLYEGGLTEGVLREAFRTAPIHILPTPTALLDGRLGEPWLSYASRVLDAYRSVIQQHLEMP